MYSIAREGELHPFLYFTLFPVTSCTTEYRQRNALFTELSWFLESTNGINNAQWLYDRYI